MVLIDGVELCVESFGEEADGPVLLISGIATSMDQWDAAFCERLAGHGRFVIRYDHRDTGRSVTSPPGRPNYTSDELATDPLRVLDALDIDRAHVVGVSMGGGIAQQLAARHAARVRTITLIATSPAGERSDDAPLPPPAPALAATFDDPAPEPDWNDRAAVVEYLVDGERPYAGSLGFDEVRARRVANLVIDRARDVAAGANHFAADDGSAPPFRLADIDVPTLVLHGTTDPLFPFPHGEALATEIPGASLVALEGMGHEAPPAQLWDVVIRAIADHTASS